MKYTKQKWRPSRAAIFAFASIILLTMISRGNIVFGIRAFDSSISVDCANAEIRDALDRYLFPPLPRSESAPMSPDVHLVIDRRGDHFRVEIDQKVAASAITLHDAALAAVKALDDAVVHRMKMFRAVHAGALLIDGKALLLPGTSHAGKSSLVAELLRRGASHFSDEYALIDDQASPTLILAHFFSATDVPCSRLFCPKNSTRIRQATSARRLDSGSGLRSRWQWESASCRRAKRSCCSCATPLTKWRNLPRWSTSFFALQKRLCFEGERGEAAEAATCLLDLIRHK